MTIPLDRPVRSQYEDFMRHVQTHGVFKADRTGTGTTSVFAHQMRNDDLKQLIAKQQEQITLLTKLFESHVKGESK